MKKRFFANIILILFIIAVLSYLFLHSSKLSFQENKQIIVAPSIPIIPPYLVNIFEKEQYIRSPFNFNEIEQPQFSTTICPITAYGAIGDGKTLNTIAFASAIKDCVKLGGGIVEVPAGQWLTGAIKLETNINLHLNKDATIIFSENPKDYLPVAFSRYEGVEYNGFSPFIYASHSKNIAITGQGKLDGQGQLWWPKNNMNATYGLYDMANQNIPTEKRVFEDENMMLRPSFIQFENCNSVLLEDFTITNSPMWTIHPIYSSNILMRNLIINTPGLNTDGIAIDSSRNILIENSTIESGDDAIVIKSGRDLDGQRVNIPSENIVIRGCNILDGHGGISFGSETSGGIKNVFAYNNNIKNSTFAIRFKSAIGRGGMIENIWVTNMSAGKITSDCIQLNTNYDVQAIKTNTALPTFRNIYFDNITCARSSDSINIVGLENNPIENISFKNISIYSKNEVSVLNANNITFFNVIIENKNDSPLQYILSNSQNISIDGSTCSQLKNICTELPNKKIQ